MSGSLSLRARLWAPVVLILIVLVVAASLSTIRMRGQVAANQVEQSALTQKLVLSARWAALQDAEAAQAVARQLQGLVQDSEERAALDKAMAATDAAAATTARQAFVALQQRKAGDLAKAMAGQRVTATWGTVAAMLLLAALISGVTVQLVRTVVEPIRRLMRAAEDIAEGDLSHPLHCDRGDEIGQLQKATEHMRERLAELVTQAGQGADSVQTAASEIASGNMDLSQRTETTAAHVQQTNSAIDELGTAVRHSAESAATANQLAQQAASEAAQGGQAVGEVVATMQEINSSSKKIADIISVIDGIAFQTNILALNAAVEAARAGEQGRGFAVVAGEVRNLASRSAEAAKEIKSLIGASVEKVEAGTRQVQQAGSTIEQLVGSVKRVSDVIGEISAATAEQNQHLSGVTGSMQQLDQMAQSNAALVEEGAAAAESLKEQAVKLHGLVSAYKVSAHKASSTRAPSAKPSPAPKSVARPAAKPFVAKAAPAPTQVKAPPPAPRPAPAPAPANDGDWETF